MASKKLTVIVEKTNTGFSCYVKEIDGLVSVGDTLAEIKSSIKEVLKDHIEYLQENGDVSLRLESYQINYVLDLKQLFEYLNVINKTEFAEKYIDMNASLFRQYTKGLTPFSSEKISKISEGLHKLASELNDLTLI